MKVSNLLKKEKGFTLIEIVLVLAIAGLILVIVFLAVSGAQRARRDTQRKNDASRVAALVTSLAANKSGNLPTVAEVNTAFGTPTAQQDPDGNNYTVTGATNPGIDVIGYKIGAFCPGVAGAAGGRDYSVYAHQETSAAVPFCVDSH